MNHKIGDRIKVGQWKLLSKQSDEQFRNKLSLIPFTLGMKKYCGKYVTIKYIVVDNTYRIEEDSGYWVWADYMFINKI